MNRATFLICKGSSAVAQPRLSSRVVKIMPSSVIQSFAYDPASRSLAVEFVSGRRYRYDDVPGRLVEEMRQARSKGKFFNRHIRDHFATTEID